jgi:hypothetical protein
MAKKNIPFISRSVEKGPAKEQKPEIGHQEIKDGPVEVREISKATKESLGINKELKKEIEAMDVAQNAKEQLNRHATTIQPLQEEEKVKQLLHLAKEKGVIYAVGVAKKMGDPYFLDKIHDILAQEGYYKQFHK